MTTDEEWADRIDDVLGRAFEAWLGQLGRGQGREGDVRWLAGPPGLVAFNVILASGSALDLQSLERAEQDLSAVEPRHRITARSRLAPAIRPWAEAHGYVETDRAPTMVLEGDAFRANADAPSPRTRRAAAHEASAFSDAAAAIFGLPADDIRPLTPDSLAVHPQSSLRIATVDGPIVGTAQCWIDGEAVGIFNVAVAEEHRHQGLGAELTAAVVADGAAAGGAWAYLQASDDGLPVYERMGFRVVDEWISWMPADIADAH